MARGFLGGILWGSATVAVSAVALSVMAPLAPRPSVSDTPARQGTADTLTGTVASVADHTALADVTEPAPRRILEPASTATAPAAPDTLAAVDGAATEPGQVPQAGNVSLISEPPQTAQDLDIMLAGSEPVLPVPQALAPMAPAPQDGVEIETQPATPPRAPAPEITVTLDPLPGMPQPDPAPERAGPVIAGQGAAQQEEQFAALQPQPLPDPVAAGQSPSDAPPVLAPLALAPQEPAVIAEDTVPVLPEPATAPSITEESAPLLPASPEVSPEVSQPAPRVVARTLPETTATTTQLRIGRPAGSLIDRAEGSQGSRLPSLAGIDTQAGSAEGAEDAGFDGRPVAQFAQEFENPEGKPLMSIVLMDDGQDLSGGTVGLAALRSFPYPISFAVRADLADARERMAAYREQGFEVLATVNMPEGATPTDAEVTVEVALTQLPEIVGLMEGTEGGVQESRALSDQVAEILSQTGHGLVVQSKGLNTAAALARKQGVPAAAVFRDVDSKGQRPTVIRRFLDQAAFKAKQEGAVIILGRVRPDTISALLVWGLADRVGSVAMAPVSAVLTAEQ